VQKIIFFRTAWMKEYKGITINDVPRHGGKYVEEHGFGAEVYNFQPYQGKMYGFVEAGYKPELRHIDIRRLGASEYQDSIGGVLVVWVARSCNESGTFVVGWYKDATVYKTRQDSPQGANRKLPDGDNAIYFAEADEFNCCLIPWNKRDFQVGRGEGLFGRSSIWYAASQQGARIRLDVLEYIKKWEKLCK